MHYETWLSYRYLIAKKDKFLALINWVSVAGIAIGVAALVVVIGVMSGFDRDLKNKIVGSNAHILLERETGVKSFELLRQQLKDIKGIEATSVYVHGNVFLETGSRAYNLLLRGIDPTTEGDVTQINTYLKDNYRIEDLKQSEVIIGKELARYYGYRVGDYINLLSPVSGVAGAGWKHSFRVAAIFESAMYDYDRNLILVDYRDAQKIFNLTPSIVSGVSVRVSNIDDVVNVKTRIIDRIGFVYEIRTWMEQNATFFAALNLEKLAMFIILTLIILVASFNIISTLIVTVTSKTKDIGILRSIGVPAAAIQRIFTLYGLALGLMGTFWGVVGGLTITYVLQETDLIKLPPAIYYIDRLPVFVQLSDVMIICASSILISYLATVYPSLRAAQLSPVEALRYQ